MSGGREVTTEALREFAKHLDRLEESLQKSADMVGSCVADPGLFGIFGGQAYGAGASMHCGKARDQLNEYAENMQKFSDKMHEAAKLYESNEQDSEKLITAAGDGIDEVKVK
ncbi:type VII secretion target [Amycolatopsis sp. cmx-11-51]|uniref:type VII secretion target n=1 Tax=Amycolatopsis sp. cmx-11-51 TaxID=2785797 RepID=UPI0039E5E8F2